VRQKFGAINSVPGVDPFPLPRFRHIEESDAITVLASISARSGGSVALSNLVGFEWVGIEGIAAGSYVASPMPAQGRFPSSTSSLTDVATYCLLGSSLQMEDLNIIAMPDSFVIVSPERIRPHPTLHPKPGPNGGLMFEYQFEREVSPITVLSIDDRVIAMRHQERLVSLLEAGIKEALCLIHYGYGAETIAFLPTLDPAFLVSDRPPRISDFTDSALMVRIPVQTPRTLVALLHHKMDLAVLESVPIKTS
jgi:hypothetical protein